KNADAPSPGTVDPVCASVSLHKPHAAEVIDDVNERKCSENRHCIQRLISKTNERRTESAPKDFASTTRNFASTKESPANSGFGCARRECIPRNSEPNRRSEAR